MELSSQKRIASKILKVGKNKIWMNPDSEADIKEAITKEDIRELIRDGVIRAKKVGGPSRGRYRKKLRQKRKGLRRGIGSRKGKRVAKKRGKKVWVAKVRGLRKILSENKTKFGENYQQLRKAVKAGTFKNKKQLLEKIGVKEEIKVKKLKVGESKLK